MNIMMMMAMVMMLAIMLIMMLTISSMTTSHIFFVVVCIAKLHIEIFQVSNIEIPPWLFTLKVIYLFILFLQVTCEGEAWSLKSSHRKIKGKNFGGTLLLFFLFIFILLYFTFILSYINPSHFFSFSSFFFLIFLFKKSTHFLFFPCHYFILFLVHCKNVHFKKLKEPNYMNLLVFS
jgi:hypothetical protein